MPLDLLPTGPKKTKRMGAMCQGAIRGHEIVVVFFPVRGILYSLVLHGLALWVVATIPLGHTRLPQTDSAREIETTLIPNILPDATHSIIELPAVTGMDPHVITPKESRHNAALSGTGIRFAGSQRIASNFPHPSNWMQTILEPDLISPPVLNKLISSPNLLELTAPAPVPAPRVADARLPMPARTESSHPALLPLDQANSQSLIVLGIAPSPTVPKTIPAGEMRGQFSVSGSQEVSSTRPASGPTINTHNGDTSAMVGESNEDEFSTGGPIIPGITIQGGELETDSLPPGSPSRKSKSEPSSYGLTILSSGNSGGGLGDFGIFSNESVFTVYIDVEDSQGNALPSWILQFAVTELTVAPENLVTPPLPANRVLPTWPADLADRYRGQMIVVRALIDDHGRFQDVQALQSPRPELSLAVMNALAKWRFEPASVRGRPVTVKTLLGIPVISSQER